MILFGILSLTFQISPISSLTFIIALPASCTKICRSHLERYSCYSLWWFPYLLLSAFTVSLFWNSFVEPLILSRQILGEFSETWKLLCVSYFVCYRERIWLPSSISCHGASSHCHDIGTFLISLSILFVVYYLSTLLVLSDRVPYQDANIDMVWMHDWIYKICLIFFVDPF